MNSNQLWNDHTFHVLLADLFKARKDNELGPMRLEVLLSYMKKQAQSIQAPESLPAPQAQLPLPEMPLQVHELIRAQSIDQIFQETAPHINAMLQKIAEAGAKSPNPVFQVAFTKNEGMYIQELPMYLDRPGCMYYFVENGGFNPQHGWVIKVGRRQ